MKQRLQKLVSILVTWWLKLRTFCGGKPVWQIKEGHTIVPAFIAGGVQYYMVKDVFNTHTLRGMSAVEIYDKWNMRMDRSTLQKYINEIREQFRTGKTIDLNRVIALINSMQDRMDYVLPPREYLWDLFCVTYFDKSESPYAYDPEYQEQKKLRLKQSGKIDDFFLFTRLSELLPLPKLSAEDLAAALRVIESMEQVNSEILSGRKQGSEQKVNS